MTRQDLEQYERFWRANRSIADRLDEPEGSDYRANRRFMRAVERAIARWRTRWSGRCCGCGTRISVRPAHDLAGGDSAAVPGPSAGPQDHVPAAPVGAAPL